MLTWVAVVNHMRDYETRPSDVVTTDDGKPVVDAFVREQRLHLAYAVHGEPMRVADVMATAFRWLDDGNQAACAVLLGWSDGHGGITGAKVAAEQVTSGPTLSGQWTVCVRRNPS